MITTDNNTKEKSCLTCGNSFSAERSTKKYCSDTCKQIAFYQRNTSIQSPLSDNNSLPFDGKREDQSSAVLITAAALQGDQPVPFTIPLTVNDKKEPDNATEHKHPPPVKDKYQAVHSVLIDAIAEAVDGDTELLIMTTNPQHYWQGDTLAAVTWISIRLRCLLENLLWLGRHSLIERKTFIHIRNAFSAMLASPNFKRLPLNYPYTNLIKELEQQCNSIARQHKKESNFRLQLTAKRKVQFIATRFLLAAFVPKVKFGDLNFEN